MSGGDGMCSVAFHLVDQRLGVRPVHAGSLAEAERLSSEGIPLLRAPREGIMRNLRQIGDAVHAGEIIAQVDGSPVPAPFDGMLRGLVQEGLVVKPGMKIGDVDPRAKREACFTISDKALAIGGGVLEAILSWMSTREDAGRPDGADRLESV